MADPRKLFSVATCEKGQKVQQTDTAKRRDFFSGLGKVGDLEILNDIGYGKVGEGLRTIAKTSNSVRIGAIDPNSLGTDANAETYVYGECGINQNAATQVAQFNPGVANRASGQAKSIFDKVKQGNFELSDIPETFSDLQNLSILIDGIYTDPKGTTNREFAVCGASAYATDLISWAPKYKFLFVVQFEFTAPYREKLGDIQAAFVVKNSTRPNINFEYDEVNMYNYWTRIPKRTIYEPMTMRFYDDNKNQAMSLYNAYLQAMSPISSLPFDQMTEDARGILEAGSMDFSQLNQNQSWPGHTYAASYGPTAGIDTMNIFKRITLFHVYNAGRLMNVYKFYNPKILTMELDDLDMAENGNGNEVSFQFAYDSVNIVTNYDVNTTSPYNIANLSGLDYGATYPLRYVGDTSSTTSDPNRPISQDLPQPQSSSVLSNTRTLISNAFNSANEYLGSLFL